MVLSSGNSMSSIEGFKRFPTARLKINKNIAALGFHGQPLHVAGTATFRQARKHFLVYCYQSGNPPPPPTSCGLLTKDEVDAVIDETEKITDYVEDVAETVDKVAKDVADHLPEGGEWRNAVVFVEGVAEEIAREAHLVEDFLHEVEEVEEKVELLFESGNDQTKNVHEDLNKR
ncbi:hypothetical protein OSB04_005581 [Centaurea solstitialis]|uniref:Uncharacterized protein n=1 Tax=Centaurea solstitialis TaxID=347529 RepID=A0AA38WS72_9ASTR|nr:hypothetical protein OSB04_005581 [Centaurea solstitialis]